MKGYEAAARCFYIVRYQGYINTLEICNLFNVSERTVRRDMRFLKEAGYRVTYSTREKGYLVVKKEG